MHHHILLRSIAAATIAISVPATAQSSSADELALRTLKTELWPRAYREGDETLLETLLATEFQMIDADGNVSTRAQEIAYVASKQPDPPERRFRFDIDRLQLFENGTAIVSGTGHVVEAPREGRSRAFTYKSSNVLIRRGGRWQAISSHVSGVKPMPEQR